MKKLLGIIAICVCNFWASAQYGNGQLGAVNISSSVSINHYGSVIRIGGNEFQVDDESFFTVGAPVFIHQISGNNAGMYEVTTITGIRGNFIELGNLTNNAYSVNWSVDEYCQIVTIPQFKDLFLNANASIESYFDSSTKKGGVVVFMVKDSLVFRGANARIKSVGWQGGPGGGTGGVGSGGIGGVFPNAVDGGNSGVRLLTGRNGGGNGGLVGGAPNNSVVTAPSLNCIGCGTNANYPGGLPNRLIFGGAGNGGNSGFSKAGSGGGGAGNLTNGEPGLPGAKGGAGGAGGAGGGIIFAIAKIIALPASTTFEHFDISGAFAENALNGANGLKGGDGGHGGGDCLTAMLGGGGKGGDGGDGGSGGNGGAGGAMLIRTTATPINWTNLAVNIKGGQRGQRGFGGTGGPNGLQGITTSNLSYCDVNEAGAGPGAGFSNGINYSCDFMFVLNTIYDAGIGGSNTGTLVDSGNYSVITTPDYIVTIERVSSKELVIRVDSIYGTTNTGFSTLLYGQTSSGAKLCVESIFNAANNNYTNTSMEMLYCGMDAYTGYCYNLVPDSLAGGMGLNGFDGTDGGDGMWDFEYALPVELAKFTAAKLNMDVALHWSTVMEKNNDKFLVQRSFDGKAFMTIGEVKGLGNSNQLANYQFIDNQPQDVNYYRLQQIDFDGTSAYSPIRVVRFGASNNQIRLWPNPAKDQIQITAGKEPIQNLEILDVHGRKLSSNEYALVEQSINIKQLSQGIYFVLITIDGKVHALKFVKNN